MKLSLEKASLKVGEKVVDGVLLIVKKTADECEDIGDVTDSTQYVPDQLFVALNSKPVFYSNNYEGVDEMLWNYNNIRSADEDYLSRSFQEKESGLFVNFFQPTEHYEGDPVYVTVTNKAEYVPQVDEDED